MKINKALPLALTASALTLASAAQASVTLYESDKGKFSTYGLLQFDVEVNDGKGKFQDQGSRIGFSGERNLNHNLTGFANVELRYEGHERNESEIEVRDTYFGLRGDFGELKLGNFDSVVYDLVTAQADIMENVGWRSFIEDSTHAQGRSLAYTLPELADGLVIALAAKYYSEEDSVNEKQQINFQFAANYSLTEEFSLGFGIDQNNKNADPENVNSKGKTKPIIAVSGLYATDDFHLGLVAEQSDKMVSANFSAGVNYGAGEVYFLAAFQDDDNEKGTDVGLGINYELDEDFWVYAEAARGNSKNSEIQDDRGKATNVVTLGAAYKW